MIYVIAKGIYEKESLENLFSQGEFRRATRNMGIAYLSMKKCVDTVTLHWEKIQSSLGAVLGTSHGELNATAEFLSELAISNTARPLIFQSSLHNATLGFLAKQFGVTGPTLTVSNLEYSGEEALEAAETLLLSNTISFCLVTCCDLIPEKLSGPFSDMYPPQKNLKEGAATLLLANEKGISEIEGLEPIGNLETLPPKRFSQYDSDYIESLARTF